MPLDQIDLPHLDQYGKRVYWVWIAPPMDEKRPQLPEGVIEFCPYYGELNIPGRIAETFPVDKERWRIGNYLCDKPYFKVDGCFVRLADPLRTWLEEAGYKYVIQYRWTLDRLGWYVGLPDTKSAAHFKLVHGGMTVQVVIDWFPTSIEDSYKKQRYSQYGKISFCKIDDLKALEGRPRISTGTGCYVLGDEIHKWFTEVDPCYRRRVSLEKLWFEDHERKYGKSIDRCAFVLNFKESSLAMMYKLKFGGNPPCP
jgi:hypothetical protein